MLVLASRWGWTRWELVRRIGCVHWGESVSYPEKQHEFSSSRAIPDPQVKTLFAVAGWLAPAVIFIDEVDSILCARKAEGAQARGRALGGRDCGENCQTAREPR